MSESLLNLSGAPPQKQFRNVPISTSSFFSGLWTQRSPFGTPDSRYYAKFLGGRTDILIDGLNTELTNYGTIIRRPGNGLFSTANLGSAALGFYSFHPVGQNISVIADTSTTVSILTATTNTGIFTKSTNSGQTYFQGIGTTLYMGNGVDQKAYPNGGPTRNWGIAIGSVNSATGPNGVGTGSDVSFAGGTAWANPGNITANDGVFSTVTLTQGASLNSGPNLAGTGTSSGAGFIWSVTNNSGPVADATDSHSGGKTAELQATNYGFNIVGSAIITGITVSITRGSGSGTATDNDVTLLKGGIAVGNNKASGSLWPSTGDTAQSYGNSTDLWGTTWTPADINASSFGCQVSANLASSLIGNPPDFGIVDSISITVSYLPPAGAIYSDYLQGTNTGLAIGSVNTVNGVLVEIKGFQSVANANTQLQVQILKGGNLIGTVKTGENLGLSNAFMSFGGTNDLWGTTWTANDINSTGFGVSLQAVSNTAGSVSWSIDFVRITVYSLGGPTVALVGGTLTATTGYMYAFAYGNSISGDISNPTPQSALIKPSTQGVQITLTASTDSQVDQIRVFRTKDGGSTFFELPTSPYANSNANVTDNATDSTLQLLNQFTFVNGWLANSPPPAGLVKMTYHLNRMWGIVNNNVYFSALLGDDILLGVGVECWPPSNVFVFPNQVNRLLPITSGLLVFTTDDIYIITGTSRTGSNGPVLTSQLFQQGVGLLSWNALDVEGNQVFLYTSDRQFIAFTANGPSEIGFPIGVDIQNNINPTTAYVASLISGTQDKAVFIDDGASSWYRCNWNQPPEGGPAWSPKATIVGGTSAIVSVETSPGVHQLLIGQPSGKVLARSYSTFSDNGAAYSAFVTIGSLILAKPGQLAILDSIVLELQNVGSVPSVSLLLDEISGSFEVLPNAITDPPRLTPSQTIMSKRWYLSQGNKPTPCRHIQLKISFPSEIFKNELLTVTEIGALVSEE